MYWRPVSMVTIIRLFVLASLLQDLVGSKGKNRIRGVRWWNLAQSAPVSENLLAPSEALYVTPSLQPLKRKQRRLVTKNPGTVVAIAKGARMAVQECRRQFAHRRWNCPTMDNSHGGSIFGKILRKGCRETAFVYAITSAAVAHAIAKACSEGSVVTCSCGHRVAPPVPSASGRDWEWGGCSDNSQFGYKFSRDFVDVIERGRDLRYIMNLHNNEAGRMHASSSRQRECKCHGMSGSCTMKTCWMRLKHFRQVGDQLKDKFDGASRVYQGNSGNAIRNRKSLGGRSLLPVNPNHKPPDVYDLVYYEESPNFCNADNSIDFPGTRGRECNATSIGVDGCDIMCCDRGHSSETYMALERCNCTFHWCCEVTCQTCRRQRTRHLCL